MLLWVSSDATPGERARPRDERENARVKGEGCLHSSSCLVWDSTPLWVAAGPATDVLPKAHVDAGPLDWSGIQDGRPWPVVPIEDGFTV